ncbi:class I SAM-dependent methyltransferase [Massilia psychrophila]|uniref:Methyltransferase n=1 Tax=Massilia psychrophila TaxID=1603353 RepID=A0A2G8SZL9_9BURK|nr:methyltransferase domain-containing protein [Massilia psychrophila]PIL39245.1 methyltransferase [Massilia psychrophila]GGE87444.1 methyltransferase [Massilia psychrophila]
MKRLILASLLAAGLAGVTCAAQADDALKAAMSASHRSTANVARDVARHPYETLTFFGIAPTMTVVELSPGAGWYTEILAPYLRDKGLLIAAGATIKPENRSATMFMQKLNANAAAFDKVRIGVFEPPLTYAIAPANSADMVLTFRYVHNWVGMGDDKLQALLKNVYTVLKPGGVFGVVDHRLPASMKQDAKASSGYVHEAYVIKMVESAGFKLAAKSEINANPKDKANHKSGVWSLPPVLADKEGDRNAYLAIGESDRMTLKFVKP